MFRFWQASLFCFVLFPLFFSPLSISISLRWKIFNNSYRHNVSMFSFAWSHCVCVCDDDEQFSIFLMAIITIAPVWPRQRRQLLIHEDTDDGEIRQPFFPCIQCEMNRWMKWKDNKRLNEPEHSKCGTATVYSQCNVYELLWCCNLLRGFHLFSPVFFFFHF